MSSFIKILLLWNILNPVWFMSQKNALEHASDHLICMNLWIWLSLYCRFCRKNQNKGQNSQKVFNICLKINLYGYVNQILFFLSWLAEHKSYIIQPKRQVNCSVGDIFLGQLWDVPNGIIFLIYVHIFKLNRGIISFLSLCSFSIVLWVTCM